MWSWDDNTNTISESSYQRMNVEEARLENECKELTRKLRDIVDRKEIKKGHITPKTFFFPFGQEYYARCDDFVNYVDSINKSNQITIVTSPKDTYNSIDTTFSKSQNKVSYALYRDPNY